MYKLRCAVVLVFASGWLSASLACPVPVYQYALEHWVSDPYEVVVTYAGALSAEQEEALAMLRRAGEGGAAGANLTVRVAEPDAAAAEDGTGEPHAARIEVRYPAPARIQRPVWTGALSREHVAALLDSPLRRKIGAAQLRRTSAVWLLLESGDRRADRETEQLLKRELQRLEKEVLVPEVADWGGETVTLDHNVNFEVLRVSRKDPAEQMLVRMLLGSEPDLEEGFAGQPIVFPVYGRGLVLYALVGRGINPWTIEEAVNFLCGPCSCQIKAANPGLDLLMSIDWEGQIRPMTPAAVGGTVGTGSFLQRLDEAQEQDE